MNTCSVEPDEIDGTAFVCSFTSKLFSTETSLIPRIVGSEESDERSIELRVIYVEQTASGSKESGAAPVMTSHVARQLAARLLELADEAEKTNEKD